MNPVENYGDWMKGISGSRRMMSEVTIEEPTSIDKKTRESQSTPRETALLSAVGNATQAGGGRWARLGWRWNELPRGDRPHLWAFSEAGPVDWIQTIRGILFFGILAATIWLEWVAIKAIASYVATFL